MPEGSDKGRFDAALKGFFLVDDENSYGGDQSWYSAESMRNSGCAPVAGANVAAFYALEGVIPCPFSQISWTKGIPVVQKAEFMELMNLMYQKYVRQTAVPGLGVWFLQSFRQGMEKYFADAQVHVKTHALCDILPGADSSAAVEFIRKGLEKNNPVVLQLWNNSYQNGNQGYSRHFMTITAVEGSRNKADITVSTWGKRQVLTNFNQIWDEAGILNAAFMIYFELEKRAA